MEAPLSDTALAVEPNQKVRIHAQVGDVKATKQKQLTRPIRRSCFFHQRIYPHLRRPIWSAIAAFREDRLRENPASVQ